MKIINVKIYLLISIFSFNILLAQAFQQKKEQTVTQPETQQKFDIDLEQLQKSSQQIIPQQQYLETVLAGAVDSTKYILGPGDQILVKIWGPLENQFLLEITPEGYLIIPTVSDVKVSGLTLFEGSKLVKKTINDYYKNVNSSVRLVKMRKFRVYIVGEVQNPGTYYVRSADRISDVIELANGLTEWADDTRIQVKGDSGNFNNFNISSFFVSGSLDQNPTLNGGDIIYIPPIDLEKNYVVVEGNVGSEGIYQIRPGEDLYAFMTRIRAINRRSNLNDVILVRDGQKVIYDLIKEVEVVKKEELKSGDRLIIPSNRDRVYVKGEVYQAGPYPYMANFAAQDYAGMAGMLETAQSVDRIFVLRKVSGKVEKGGSVIVDKGDIVVVPQRRRENTKDILAILTPIISIGLSTYAIIQASK